ncbi:MAG: Glutamyl-tRNA(Gln) amidotransferase subunit [Vampirovibrio sp.]|jgi:aspartyl-tRNA(Asn)/glutamyl-tRNA(Gln) amidotransferase subunit A|nr:Glutamyl-tRNA(Gln) amidotransferase subunit [Vampirovibrio sp.]
MNEHLSALSLHEQIKSGERSAVEVLEASYKRIDAVDQQVGAFNSLSRELAMQTAEEVDRKAKAGDALPLLAGVPLAVKDNINVQGYATTCSSKILQDYLSPYDATVTRKVKEHLLPIVGKTNLDEFAMGSSTENSATKITRNPWDLERVPGGSSGGSAAAVAAGETLLSLGSDTGGSVRQPAALCGLVGLKPTYGLVSRYGLVAFASSLDQVSPFARNVKDTAALLQVIAGFDDRDSTSLKLDIPNYLQSIDKPVDQLKIGIISELNGDGMQPEVAAAFQQAIETFKKLGAKVHTFSIPSIKYAVASYYILATAEASSNLARFDGVRYGLRVEGENIYDTYCKTRAEGFGPEVKRRIMLGTFSLSSGYYDAYYGKAQKIRKLLKNEFDKAWQQVDVLICPTSPTTAFKIGEKKDDPVSMYLSDIATIPVNLVGIPAISIPCGFDNLKLPIGLQIMGPHLSEEKLFRISQAFETATGLANLTPAELTAV